MRPLGKEEPHSTCTINATYPIRQQNKETGVRRQLGKGLANDSVEFTRVCDCVGMARFQEWRKIWLDFGCWSGIHTFAGTIKQSRFPWDDPDTRLVKAIQSLIVRVSCRGDLVHSFTSLVAVTPCFFGQSLRTLPSSRCSSRTVPHLRLLWPAYPLSRPSASSSMNEAADATETTC